jgi:nitroimidazol reductase NimA-like FMN-containing flavoprotein (pyridoxamine 5'-phosphate oxidase superfamily)
MRRKDREVTDRDAILDIIARSDSCRLALVDSSRPSPVPYIVPLNFGFSAGPDRFWFHCAKTGRKLDLIRRNPRVCVQLDLDHLLIRGPLACDWSMAFASLLAEGTATLVENPEEQRFGLDRLMEHYSQGAPVGGYDPRHLAATAVIRVDVASLSVKRKLP